MTIEKLMSTNLITIDEDDNLTHAIRMMKENHVRHLPVVSKSGKLAGLVTDRDLKEASASDASTLEIHELLYLMDKIKIKKIMTSDVTSINKQKSPREAALVMVENDIGCIPVMEDNRLIGIVTRTDLLRYFAGLH